MSKLRRARRAVSLFAIGLSVGVLASLGNTAAGEFGASPSETFEYKIASAAPFEALRDAPDYRLSEPFGLATSTQITAGLQNQWRVVAEKLPAEREILARCRTNIDACPPAAKKFLAIVDKALTREGPARIGEINRTINLTVKWVSDMNQYGVPELWATPLMTFDSEAGDCEDYAIAKYAALQEIGIPADDLRLVVVRDRQTNQLHVVTAVRREGRWLILDNRTFIMVRDVDIASYNPLYVIGGEDVKRMAPSPSKPQNPDASISSAAVSSQFSSGSPGIPLLL
jgi:predicted transglutaminase-like cysteine proteinase